mmetsp:Transcript_6402/g.15098  ORF Transcript_6402/g.15098 Transcript_6402/m.15098 type:complete len:212 (+) Transcript_6402:570-1205(+)
MHVGTRPLGKAKNVHGVDAVEVNPSTQAFKSNQNWGSRFSSFLAFFHFIPGITSHRLLQRRGSPCTLVKLIMPFGNLVGMILLVIIVLYGPAAWPIVWICPQSLVNRFCFMEAPALELPHRFSNRHSDSPADYDQRGSTLGLSRLQCVMQGIQHSYSFVFSDGTLAHAASLIQRFHFDSWETTLVIWLARPVLVTDVGVAQGRDYRNKAVV